MHFQCTLHLLVVISRWRCIACFRHFITEKHVLICSHLFARYQFFALCRGKTEKENNFYKESLAFHHAAHSPPNAPCSQYLWILLLYYSKIKFYFKINMLCSRIPLMIVLKHPWVWTYQCMLYFTAGKLIIFL